MAFEHYITDLLWTVVPNEHSVETKKEKVLNATRTSEILFFEIAFLPSLWRSIYNNTMMASGGGKKKRRKLVWRFRQAKDRNRNYTTMYKAQYYYSGRTFGSISSFLDFCYYQCAVGPCKDTHFLDFLPLLLTFIATSTLFQTGQVRLLWGP